MNKNYLTLGGLFAGLHLILLMLSRLLIGSEFILLIFMPLISSLYTLKTQGKSFLLYALATFFLCVLFDPINTFIYVLPSLISGISYGLLRKVQTKELSLIYITTLIHFFTLLITIFSLKVFFIEFDVFKLLQDFFSIKQEDVPLVAFLILIFLSLTEAFVTHSIINKELERFSYKIIKEEKTPRCFFFLLIASLLLFPISLVVSKSLSVLVMIFISFSLLPFIVEGFLSIKHRRLTIILLFITSFLLIYSFAIVDFLYFPLIVMLAISPVTINLRQ